MTVIDEQEDYEAAVENVTRLSAELVRSVEIGSAYLAILGAMIRRGARLTEKETQALSGLVDEFTDLTQTCRNIAEFVLGEGGRLQ